MTDSDYLRRLNDFQTELACVCDLTVHLLGGLIDTNREDWESSGAWLMQNKLRELPEKLPFPGA